LLHRPGSRGGRHEGHAGREVARRPCALHPSSGRVGGTGPATAGPRSEGVGMADRMLHISWGAPIPGREERGLEVFNEAVALNGQMQQDGRIESFDIVLLGASNGPNGYIELFGSADQLAAVQEADDFRRMLIDAAL